MQDINDILENMDNIGIAAAQLRSVKNYSVLQELPDAIVLIHRQTKQRILINAPRKCEKC